MLLPLPSPLCPELTPLPSIPLQLRAARPRQLLREPPLCPRLAPDRWCWIPPRCSCTRCHLGGWQIPLYGWVLEFGAWTWREGTLSWDDYVGWTDWVVGVDGVHWPADDYGVVEDIPGMRVIV